MHRLFAMKSLVGLSILILLIAACQPASAPPAATSEPARSEVATAAPPTANLTEGCVTNYNADVDYFPEKASPTYTAGFSVDYHNHYKVVTLHTPWQGADEPLQYVLVQCGTPTPEGFADEQIFEVPVQRFIGMSTTYLPVLERLGVLDRLVGLDDLTYVNNETVRAMGEAGELGYIGYGANVNVEQALNLEPDLILTYAVGGADMDAHPKLLEAGLKVALEGSWLETSPLGRAEWGKFIALFFNQEAQSEATFAAIAERYEAMQEQVAQVAEKPTVFADTVFQGTWYMPGGQSYVAQYLADAGADYLWADDATSGSIPLAFEVVFDHAQAADFWINLNYTNSLDELLAADTRYAEFAAFQQGNVWNNNVRLNGNGGNDYYESGSANPDLVLADLIKIFHPELLPDHEFVYYQQLQ